MKHTARYLTFFILILALIFPFKAISLAAEKRITVGNKNFTEQYLVGQMITQLLEDRGFQMDLKSDLTSMALRAGMESGDIDICADYTGTAWMVYLKKKYNPGTDDNKLYELVKSGEKDNGFIWLDPIWNNNTYALASWPDFAEKHELKTLSDLAGLYRKKDGKIDTFVNFEFSTRPDGLPALQEFYNFEIAKTSFKTGTPGASLIGLKEHKTDIAMVFGTDASIAKYGWHIYVDDRSFFPPYDLTPYASQDIIRKFPEITSIINKLVCTFPGGGESATPERVSQCQRAWQKLNALVDIEKKEPKEVAYEYLMKHGLINK